MEKAVGALINAKEYFGKAFAISKEIRNRKLEAKSCFKLGSFCFMQAEYARAEEYIMNGLTLSEEIGCIEGQLYSLQLMAQLRRKDGQIQEAISYFHFNIEKCKEMRGSLGDNDQLKIPFLDSKIYSYRQLSSLTGNLALYSVKPKSVRKLCMFQRFQGPGLWQI